MDDAGTIISSYVVIFGGIAGYVWWMLRKGRSLADQISDEHKPWT